MLSSYDELRMKEFEIILMENNNILKQICYETEEWLKELYERKELENGK